MTKFTYTRRQEGALRRILNQALGLGADLKLWKCSPLSEGRTRGTLFVVVETGLPNDDNTLASVFCRNRACFVVGVRGGIKVAGVDCLIKTSKTKARRYPLIYGFNAR